MKKLLAVLLAAALVFAFAACGQPSTEKSTAFKVGCTGPLTGGAAEYGQAVKLGAEIAVEEVNALGGIQIEFKMEDDAHDAEQAVNAFNNLIDWGMKVSIGTVTTIPAEATSVVAQSNNIFFLTPSASSPNVTADKDCCFQICFSDTNQGVASADFIAKEMAGKTVAIIYRSDDTYSKGIRDTFVAEAAKVGVNVVYESSFTEATSTDFSVQVSGAKESKADIVFLPIYYTPASAILSEASKQGFAPLWFGVDGMDGVLDVDGFDTSLAEGVYLLSPFSADSKDDATVSFVAKYKEKSGGKVPNQFAADAYDCIYAVYQALNNAKCTPDMSKDDITAALKAQFTSMTFDGLTGKGMTWDKGGAVSKDPYAVIIKDGVYVGF